MIEDVDAGEPEADVAASCEKAVGQVGDELLLRVDPVRSAARKGRVVEDVAPLDGAEVALPVGAALGEHPVGETDTLEHDAVAPLDEARTRA